MSKTPPPAKPESTSPPDPKIPKHRSPNYPAISLETAVEKVKLLHEAYRNYPVSIPVGVAKMGYKKADSSTAQQAIAAIKAFGLISVVGAGEARKVVATEDGIKIAMDHPSRAELIRKAALLPAINREVWGKFITPTGLASDDIIRHYLIFDRPAPLFNPDAVSSFLGQLKMTAKFAGLDFSTTLPPSPAVDDAATGEEQVEIPMTAATMTPPANPTRTAPPLSPPAPGIKGEVFELDRGQVVVRWPERLSADDMADIEQWLPILLRKMKRGVQTAAEDKAEQ